MSPPEASSMKALMDAVAQVSRHPGYPRPPPSVAGMGAFPFPGVGAVAPQPALSAPVPLGAAKKGGPLRKRNHDSALASAAAAAPTKKARKGSKASSREAKATKSQRLEQNRLAAIESRRRKKHMVEELQRSVQFYTKANGTLKQQNAELERQLLTAKQKVLQGSTAGGTAVAEPASPGPQAPQGTSATLPERKPEAQAAAPQPSMDLNDVAALFGNGPTTAEMERQAQQAQYAATQALYKSMGYPAAAAREAAGTFSQYVGQTGIVPGLSSAPQSQAGAKVPQVVPPAAPVVPDAVTSTAADEGTYVHALNQFAMQQAAAANAAAAAATAAIQAVHLHNQLSGTNGAPPSMVSSPPAVALPFAFPTAGGMAWPFQGPNPFAKRD